MSDATIFPDGVDSARLDLPDSFEIPDELLKRWAELPRDFRFSPDVPKVSWDALYTAIDELNFAVISGMQLVFAAQKGQDQIKEAMTQLGVHSIKAQNSLRHFQAMLMAEALKAHGDG